MFSSPGPHEEPDYDYLRTLEVELAAHEEEFRRRLREGAIPASELFQLEEARSIVRFAREFCKKTPAAGLIILEDPPVGLINV